LQTSDILWQSGIALFGAVAGALTAQALPGKKSNVGAKYDLRGASFEANENVTIGDVNLNITKDDRVYITAKTASAIAKQPDASGSISDREALREQRRQEERLRRLEEELRRQKKSNSEGSNGDSDELGIWIGGLILAFVLVAGVVLLYLKYREDITLAVALLAIFALTFALSALGTTAIQRVKLGGLLRVQVAANVALTVAAVYSLNWLVNPPSSTNRADFMRLLESAKTFNLVAFVQNTDSNLIFAVFYQIIGLVLLTASLCLVFIHSVMVYAISGLAVRTRADNNYEAGLTRRRIMGLLGGPTTCWLIAIVISAFSFFFLTGFASSYVQRLNDASTSGTNVQSPPSTGTSPAPPPDPPRSGSPSSTP
jgi:hypothetical protein